MNSHNFKASVGLQDGGAEFCTWCFLQFFQSGAKAANGLLKVRLILKARGSNEKVQPLLDDGGVWDPRESSRVNLDFFGLLLIKCEMFFFSAAGTDRSRRVLFQRPMTRPFVLLRSRVMTKERIRPL